MFKIARLGIRSACLALLPLAVGGGYARGSASPIATSRAAPTVNAAGEELVGTYAQARPAVASFKGIPYAAPPLGRLRWRAPQPYVFKARSFEATRFAPACYQNDYNIEWYRRVWRAFGVSPDPFHNLQFSEDCLYLNIWTPEPHARAGLPVMVWIHGGNDVAGWAYEPNYRGAALAADGHVVVVSIGYRLGIFGFFSHPQLLDSAAPANFGLLDQIAALRWIRDNIGAFGGDADNVTIFGESAGGADVAYLLASPMARGLYRRAIIESGAYLLRYQYSFADAQKTGIALARALPGNPDLGRLRGLPAAEIFAAALKVKPDNTYLPVVDGKSLTLDPARYFRRHGIAASLLIGSNANEGYMYDDGRQATLDRELMKFPRPARRLLSRFAAAAPNARLEEDRLESFVEMACPSYLLAAASERAAHRAWVYRFTRRRAGPGGRLLLVYHGSELPYVFDTQDSWLPVRPVDRELTRRMSRYWTNFARDGNPNGPNLPSWVAFSSRRPEVQDLGLKVRPIPPPHYALCMRVAPLIYPGWAREAELAKGGRHRHRGAPMR